MNNVSFSPLTNEEIEKQLKFLAKRDIKVLIWVKGSNDKDEVLIDHFNTKHHRIFFKTIENKKSQFVGKEVMFSYSLRGVSFFGKGRLTHDPTISSHVIAIEDNLYKSERRNNFRLLTFPHLDVRCVINLEKNYSKDDQTKVIEFSKSKGDTGLFDQFISLVNEGEPSTNDEQLVFRVQDISVSGLALIVGELEKNYFVADTVLKHLQINIGKGTHIIPGAKVVYVAPYKAHNNPDLKQYKIGIHFEKIPGNVDSALGKFINSNLKEADIKKVFEDFLK